MLLLLNVDDKGAGLVIADATDDMKLKFLNQ